MENGLKRNVILGNHTTMSVVGKGSVRLVLEGFYHTVKDVFYVSDLKNNLLSIRQLQEKGLAVLIKDNQCRIYHPTKGLVITRKMTANKMFVLLTNTPCCKQTTSEKCFQADVQDLIEIWHCRYGHLSYTGLKTLKNKEMVKWLPHFAEINVVCTGCLKGK